MNYRYTGVANLHLYVEEVVDGNETSRLLEQIPDFIWTSEKQEKVDKPLKRFVNSNPKHHSGPDQDIKELDIPF